MLESTAVVATDTPERYAKQLLSHLGHKVRAEPLPDHPEPAGQLVFAYGIGTVLPESGSLVLRAVAGTTESLVRLQGVLGRHLEKFGARRELVVNWGETTGEPQPAAVAEPSESVAEKDIP